MPLSREAREFPKTDGDGAYVVLRFIGPGNMFGTLALFTDRRYLA